MNLAYRTTSHGGDEAICLAVLLKRTDLLQDILAVSSGPDTRYLRYTVLLDALKDVPRSFLFKDVARVSEDGLRWAPRSFLGDYKPVEFLAYTENNELDTRTCKVHSEGLCTTGAGVLLVGCGSTGQTGKRQKVVVLRELQRAIIYTTR